MIKQQKEYKKGKELKGEDLVKYNYEKWKSQHKGGKNTKEDHYKKVMEAWEFIERSRDYLRHSCYHDAYQEDNTAGLASGGSWYERWELHEKMALMWYRDTDSEDFISNIKSPMARGRINTFVNWIKKVNIEFNAKPNNPDDRNAAFVAEKLINYWINNSSAKSALGDAWEDLAIHGNTFLKVSYITETKEYQFHKTKDLTKEDKEKVEKGEKIIYTEPEEKLIIDDVVLEHVPLQECFPDPQSRSNHGDTYRAERFGRVRIVTLDYVKSVFGNHPQVENLDMIKGASAYRDLTDYFFDPPTDYERSDLVELVEIEDQENDRYMVIANDICILDTPLPQNHKRISYHKLDFIRVPGQYFSIGICDLLENIQGSYEIALNMVADYIYRTYNYRILVDAASGGEITEAISRSDDMVIEIDASDGRPITQKIVPLPVTPMSFDIFSYLQLLETNATLATNIDPAQMALLASSKTATSDILNKELLMTLIGGVIETNVNGDLKEVGRQVWALMQQHYTKKRVKKVVGDDGEEKQELANRTFRFDGIEIEVNDDKVLEEKELGEGEYSFFELEDDYINTREEIDIGIKPESMEVQSQALKEQRSKETFAQLIPFAVDPNNQMQVQNHPMPMVDAVELFKEYFYDNRLPEGLLIPDITDGSRAIEEADAHITAILRDEAILPVPGQPEKHLEREYQVYEALIEKAYELNKRMEKQMKEAFDELMNDLVEQGVQFDPQSGTLFDPVSGQRITVPPPQPDPEMQEELETVEDRIEKLEQHLLVESMPASLRNTRIGLLAGGGAPPAEEGAVPPPPMPEGSDAPQVNPNDINNPNPAMNVPMMGGAGTTTLPNQAPLV